MTCESELEAAQSLQLIFDPDFYIARCSGRVTSHDALQHFLREHDGSQESPHPLFDARWYASRCGLGSAPTSKLVAHYFRTRGADDPHPLFDSRRYRGQQSIDSDATPLVDFIAGAQREFLDQSPTPFFDPAFYKRTTNCIGNPLLHYLRSGWREGLAPSPYFAPRFYLASNKDVAEAGIEPLTHFVLAGADEGRWPHPLIDLAYYRRGSPDVPEQALLAFKHFVECGDRDGCGPHPAFDASHYQQTGEDTGGWPPFAHYVEFGAAAGRSCCIGFDPAHYALIHGASADCLSAYLQSEKDRRHFHPLLDGGYQRLTSPNAAGRDPLIEYAHKRHGRTPSADCPTVLSPPLQQRLRPFVTGSAHGLTKIAGQDVSVIVDCTGSDAGRLRDCLQSVIDQQYQDLELIVVLPASAEETTHEVVQMVQCAHRNVRVELLPRDLGPSFAKTWAARVAGGDWLIFVGSSDRLLPGAIKQLVGAVVKSRGDVAYSDEATFAQDGLATSTLKPDWSPLLEACTDYVGHPLLVRRALAAAVGFFRSRYDNCEEYDYLLRLSQRTTRIVHVSAILYYRYVGSNDADDVTELIRKARKMHALRSHLALIGLEAEQSEGADSIGNRIVHLRPRVQHTAVSVDVIVQGPVGDVVDDIIARWKSVAVNIVSIAVADGKSSPASCVALGRAPWILFIDPTVTPDCPVWFEQLRMHAALADVAFAATAESTLVQSKGAAVRLEADRESATVSAQCALIARESFMRLGNLDDVFLSCEGFVAHASSHARVTGQRNVVLRSPTKIASAVPSANPAWLDVDRQLFLDEQGRDSEIVEAKWLSRTYDTSAPLAA